MSFLPRIVKVRRSGAVESVRAPVQNPCMVLRRGVTLQVVEREPEMLPFVAVLLREWIGCGFDPVACRRALDRALDDPTSRATDSLLHRDAVIDGGPVATHDLLHPAADRALRVRVFEAGAAPRSMTARFDEASAMQVGRIVRAVTRDPGGTPPPGLPERMATELGTVERDSAMGFPRIDEPGIYRREHGSIVIRSETTTLVLDPVAHWMPDGLRHPIEGGIDAIFITHGHADHFDVASILACATTTDTPVVVPPVPRCSLLAPNDMAATLAMFGQATLAPAWGTSLTIGDIRVDVLPYYGEQPVRDGEGPPADVRNWGSCYRFATPQLTAIALIDSGADPAGDMVDVVGDASEQHGPVDFLLSSLARFPSPFFLGLPHYYLSLPFDRLRELFELMVLGRLPSVTLGPDGVVDVCRAGRPRHFLPYGNGFAGLGKPIRDVGMHTGEPAELAIVQWLADRFEHERIPTRPIAWNPGDRVSLREGRVERVVCA
jgi:L-ascorbate metabolism protein UlaG (beta-lactamase superfamily)